MDFEGSEEQKRALEAIETDDAEALAELMPDEQLGRNESFLSRAAYKAALGCHVDCLCFLIEAGADVNWRDHAGWTALHKAALDNNLEATRLLIAAGADLELRSGKDTPYAASFFQRSFEMAALLIRSGANARPRPDSMPLPSASGALAQRDPELFRLFERAYHDAPYTVWHAAYDDNDVVLKRLLREFEDENSLIYAQDEEGMTPLHWAAKSGSFRCVSHLLSTDKLHIWCNAVFGTSFTPIANVPDSDGNTALHLAVTNGDENGLRCIQSLLDHNAPINAKNAIGETPLHKAIVSLNDKAVAILLKSGADVNAKDASGRTAIDLAEEGDDLLGAAYIDSLQTLHAWQGTKTPHLHNAVAMNDLEHVKTLLEADPGSINSYDHYVTPLHLAQSAEMATLLIERGAAVNATGMVDGSYNIAPLHTVYPEVVRVLLEHGADVDGGDHQRTRLHYAAKFANQENAEAEILEMLLAAGARVDARDENLRTPLHWAAEGNSPDTAKLLLAHGADVNARDKGGNTPLDDALKNQANSVVSVLIEHGAVTGEGELPGSYEGSAQT